MNEYSNEKELEIRERKLPANHPDLLLSYYNVDEACEKLKDYRTYERAVDISQ